MSTLFSPWLPSWILHEDLDLLVVDKPEGISTHSPDALHTDDCVTRLRAYLSARDGVAPASVYLGIHQRLDRDTSGVLTFSRRKSANPSLAKSFEGRAVEKAYVAAVQRSARAPKEGRLTHDLVERDGRIEALAPGMRPKGQRATTRFRELSRHGDRCLLALYPETGRTHQLRAQCAAMGNPIVGDPLYGGEPYARMLLHAESLTLAHPSTARKVSYRAPLPPDFEAWMKGAAVARSLTESLVRAGDRRYSLATDPDTTAFRLSHDADLGREIAVDVYDQWALVHLHKEPDATLDDREILDAVYALGFRGVYVKYRPKQASTLVDTRRDRIAPREAVRGESAPEEFVVREHGMKLLARLGDGLSTGVFLDMRENRRRVRELARDKTVLNLFAYTCPFTVAAAVGGASRSVSVDVSQTSLAWGRKNLAENGCDSAAHVTVAADVFGWLEGARSRRDRFDLVVLDPPSYSTAHGSRFSAESDYKKLAQLAMEVVAPGGKLLACTNHRGIVRMKFRRYLHEAARALGRELTQLKDMPVGVDFSPAPGEEAHLKCALATLP